MIRLQNLSSSIVLYKSSKHPGTTSEPEVIGVVIDPASEEKKNYWTHKTTKINSEETGLEYLTSNVEELSGRDRFTFR